MNLTYRGVSYQPQPRAYATKKTNINVKFRRLTYQLSQSIEPAFLTGTLKTTVGLILMWGILLWPLNMVAKAVPSPRDTAQQLEGIVARNWFQWPWSVS